jgi:uroporphyrin-III C-methyltransferase
MPETIAPGTVWLVGAGPGDPDLLTRKAEKLIAAADIVFTDALVGSGVIDLIPETAEIVSVGKRSGRHGKDQRTINAMLVAAAHAGKRVVRLKGGDPSIFGRSSEELGACRKAGVRVSICPGITAASAAVASVGASLTLRGVARKLSLVTAHARKGEDLILDWKTLADPQATLAIYMGKAVCRTISQHLIAAGLPSSTPAVVVENASLPNERIVRTTLALLEIATSPVISNGPAMLLMGASMAEPSRTEDIDIKVRQSDHSNMHAAP